MWWILVITVILIELCSSGADPDYLSCVKNPKTCFNGSYQNWTNLLTNKHLVMVGDSLTRYQYMSLVYMLRHGHVLSPFMNPNIVQEKDWSGWNEFFASTNSLLKPFEVCDCYRPDGITSYKVWFDNHYYSDPINNITITFISYIGNPTGLAHGHIPAAEVNDTELTRKYPLTYHTEDKWKYESLSLLFKEYVSRLPVKPSAVVLNMGRWGPSLTDVEVSEIVFSVFEIVELFVWKSTTFAGTDKSEGLRSQFDQLDGYFKSYEMVTFMNTSWTGALEEKHRWDVMHFKEPIYSILNNQLLDILTAGFSKAQDES